MQILILGGTSFVGRAIAIEAVSRGHAVTLLNRGTKPGPEGTTSVVGDRLSPNGGLSGLDGKTFDAAIDTWYFDPAVVSRAVEILKGRVAQYVYISSLSVYDVPPRKPGDVAEDKKLNDESCPLFDVASLGVAADAKTKYAFNKRSAEIAVERLASCEETIPLILRPGVILGPYEADIIERGRLPWWLTRLARGGKTLAPGLAGAGLQFVDVRDLAAFTMDCVERRGGGPEEGPYNLIDRAGRVTWGSFLGEIKEVVTAAGAEPELVWKTPDEIEKAGIQPWGEVPMWLDPASDMYHAVYRWDNSKAVAAGLRCRDPKETVRDTWEWMRHGEFRPEPAPEGYDGWLMGFSPEKEAMLLGQT